MSAPPKFLLYSWRGDLLTARPIGEWQTIGSICHEPVPGHGGPPHWWEWACQPSFETARAIPGAARLFRLAGRNAARSGRANAAGVSGPCEVRPTALSGRGG